VVTRPIISLRRFATESGGKKGSQELAGFIGHDPPAAVAITCSMPMSLVGAWRSISGLPALGMTVVCGGRGFGSEGRWGLALGADHWAPDFASGADIMLSAVDKPAPAPREPARGEDAITEVRVLRRDHETLVEQGDPGCLSPMGADSQQ